MRQGWVGLTLAVLTAWGGALQAEDGAEGEMPLMVGDMGEAWSSDCDASCCDAFGCDSTSCDSLGCGGQFDFLKKLKSRIRQSDRCFDDFISPMIDFVHFEDPRTLTELRPLFVVHQFPSTLQPAGLSADGSAVLMALQFRIALTERLSLIAVKDGYVIDGSEGALDGLLGSGWADIAAGLKYNFLRNTHTGTLASAGFTYEIPLGSEATLQSIGDGQFHFFVTAGQRLLDGDAHILSSVGYQVPVDDNVQTTFVHWANHLDYRLTDCWYALTEVSWRHWTDDATTGLALGVGGQDLLNLPSTNVAGNNLVTQNVGLKYKPNRTVEAGAAFEFPVSDFKDIIENRVQLELIVRY